MQSVQTAPTTSCHAHPASVCVCVHACMHACMHVCRTLYACMHACMYSVCMHVCVHASKYAFVHACVHMYKNAFVHACVLYIFIRASMCQTVMRSGTAGSQPSSAKGPARSAQHAAAAGAAAGAGGTHLGKGDGPVGVDRSASLLVVDVIVGVADIPAQHNNTNISLRCQCLHRTQDTGPQDRKPRRARPLHVGLCCRMQDDASGMPPHMLTA
jgi:hypothetical protein